MQSWKALGLLMTALVLSWSGWARAADTPSIYTPANAPATPKIEDLPLKESVSQYGITWTFEKPARVGQFVNGDYYVVGPVTIAALDPKPLFGADVPENDLDPNDKKQPREKHLRHGSMVNPPVNGDMAYDSGIRSAPHLAFRPEVAARVPIALKPGDNVISTISLKLGEVAGIVGYGNSSRSRAKHDNCPIKAAAVLTSVAAPLPADAFRPAYGDKTRTQYLARNLKRELLPKVARVEGCPDPVKYAEIFQRMWLNPGFFGFDEPMENMPHYGQQVGQASSGAGLLLCFDFTPEQKERLLLNFVQVGIDYWGLVKNGHPGWEAWGGHGSGRKLPIVLAGLLLGDEPMASPTKAFPKVEFGEDNQTAYGDCWTGAKVVFTGHSGISSATGTAPRPQWGPYEHLSPDKWTNDAKAKNWQSEGYRLCCTGVCWVGEALALRLLKAEKPWNHDAFFDYIDRWMTEDASDHPRRKAAASPPKDYEGMGVPGKGSVQGAPGEAWIGAAWKQHRTMPGMPPADGWKQRHDDAFYRSAVESMKKR